MTKRPPGPVASSIASIFVTAVILLALEGAARIAAPDSAPDDPYMGFRGVLPLFEPVEGSPDTLQTAVNRGRWFNGQRFPRTKGDEVLRVFCLGGSTVYGHPYDGDAAFPRSLEVILGDAEPGRRHEVINCGGISYASYRLTHIAREIAAYSPDVVVVLTGHNEFLERRTYGALADADPWVQNLQRLLSRSRFYGWLRGVLIGSRGQGAAAGGQLGADVVAILDHAAGLDLYHRDDAFHAAALEHFRHNLQAIVAAAKGAGALPVLVTPPSNLREFSPFKSESTGSPVVELASTRAALDAMADSDVASESSMIARLDLAIEADPRHAELHYRRGQWLAISGNPGAADSAFSQACEEDVAPLRARAGFVETVRNVATESGVPLVDAVAMVADTALARTGHRTPGNESFLDHVHPTPLVHSWIAEAIAARLVDAGVVRPAAVDWTPPSARPAVRARILDAIDPVARARSDLNLAKTLSWAGKQAEAKPFALSAATVLVDDPDAQYTAGVAFLMDGDAEAATAALERALVLAPNHARARSNLGVLFHRRGELEAAMAAFRRAAADDTSYVTPLLSLGRLLDQEGRTREAIRALSDAIDRDPNHPLANGSLGELFLKMRAYEAALRHLDTAISLDPTQAPFHGNRGLALLAMGQVEPARAALERALELTPTDDPAIRVNLAMACIEDRDPSEARRHLEAALVLRPGDAVALRLLRELRE